MVKRLAEKDKINIKDVAEIYRLAAEVGWSNDDLEKYCRRQLGRFPLRTAVDAMRALEYLSAVNRSDNQWSR